VERPNTRTSPAGLCRRWAGFGSSVELRLWPRPGQAAAGALRLAQSAAFLRRAEQRFSRFRPMSELSRLNRRAGTPVRVSRLLFRLTTDALAAARATDGLFDPTVRRALLAAGYTTTFAHIGQGSGAHKPPGPEPGRYREVKVDAVHQTVTLPSGVGLDLGGIAKGWLADMVVRRLGRFGDAAVDLGGDCAFTAPDPQAPPWLIEVADPWVDGQALDEFTLDRCGGVATSGIVRRRWWTSRGWQHHLIDPRDGRPAATDLASVTVLAPSAAAAEVMAKVVLLLGRDLGTHALARRTAFAGLLVPLVGPPTRVGASFGQRTPLPEAAS
jgi:thiamine biosynthesis lipoprotein